MLVVLVLVLVVLVLVVVELVEVLDVTVLDDVEDEEVVTVLWMKRAVREAVPELAPLFASPGYVATMVTAPGVAPVTDIAQVPPELRLHVPGEEIVTLPGLPACCENPMVSPAIAPAAPVTVAVHVEAPPMSTKAGVQSTLVEVEVEVLVEVEVVELVVVVVSPVYVNVVTAHALAPSPAQVALIL